jgi:hypothetical protein
LIKRLPVLLIFTALILNVSAFGECLEAVKKEYESSLFSLGFEVISFRKGVFSQAKKTFPQLNSLAFKEEDQQLYISSLRLNQTYFVDALVVDAKSCQITNSKNLYTSYR